MVNVSAGENLDIIPITTMVNFSAGEYLYIIPFTAMVNFSAGEYFYIILFTLLCVITTFAGSREILFLVIWKCSVWNENVLDITQCIIKVSARSATHLLFHYLFLFHDRPIAPSFKYIHTF